MKSRGLHSPLSPTSPGWRAGSPALPGHLHRQIRVASWFYPRSGIRPQVARADLLLRHEHFPPNRPQYHTCCRLLFRAETERGLSRKHIIEGEGGPGSTQPPKPMASSRGCESEESTVPLPHQCYRPGAWGQPVLWFTQAHMGWTFRVVREGTGVWVGGPRAALG